LNYLIAVIPTILILGYIHARDIPNREPPAILMKMFVLGMVITLPASVLENIWPVQAGDGSPLELLLFSLLNIALIEEGLKFLVFMLYIWKDLRNFDEIYDGIVYAAFISLGFATLENIFYVSAYGQGTGLVRAFTAVPLHAVCSVYMGAFLGRARFTPGPLLRIFRMTAGFVVPVLIHGIYNYLLFLESGWISLVVFPGLVLLYYILGIRKIRESAELSQEEQNNA